MGVGMKNGFSSSRPKTSAPSEADLKKAPRKFFLIGRIERSESGKARVTYSGSLNL